MNLAAHIPKMDQKAKTHGAMATWSCQILSLQDILLEDIFSSCSGLAICSVFLLPQRWLKPRLYMGYVQCYSVTNYG